MTGKKVYPYVALSTTLEKTIKAAYEAKAAGETYYVGPNVPAETLKQLGLARPANTEKKILAHERDADGQRRARGARGGHRQGDREGGVRGGARDRAVRHARRAKRSRPSPRSPTSSEVAPRRLPRAAPAGSRRKRRRRARSR